VPLSPQPTPPTPEPPPPVLPQLQPVGLESVAWRVVEADGEVLFALTPAAYGAMSRNLSELASWMRQASWQLAFYRRSRGPQPPSTGAK
jgi:hypothetical protein